MSDEFEVVHDHQPNPGIACRRCGCEGFRLGDGLCDGCHESAVFDQEKT
jgi:ribosomal protein L37E